MADIDMSTITRHRILLIVEERGSITAADFCAEMIRRGWAYPDLTPDDLNLDPTDIIQRCRHA
ncbi:hypothetical protein [Magnetospirillum fulvum]|uniref:Uncharacterized protein n=1 Tax=Magnetospirillum fulvum MGU-K5 TaxID=1316936 RepID=S9SHF0_MAGFU|nr:hypothetical protein [Magnetospirillum fulvum]EPY03533.1 hypothetical protein K678_00440 [Magnetospirillum fulvum MGU-K5]